MKIYSIGHKGTESLGCGNANESHCKTLFSLPARLDSQMKRGGVMCLPYFIAFLLLTFQCGAQDIQASIDRLNKAREGKHLPKMIYAPEMQSYCDQYAHYIADRDSLIHSNPNTYNECLGIRPLDVDPLMAFQNSPAHWDILMLHWDNHICVGQFQKNGKIYIVVRTY